MIDLSAQHRRREFDRTGNPLFAWDMVLQCCKENEPFPTWVLKYLESAAEELVNLSPPKGKAPSEIRDALGFKGKPFDEYSKFLKRNGKSDFEFKLAVYHWVQNRLESGAPKREVFETAGRHFHGEDPETSNHWRTVQKDYIEMEKLFKYEEVLNRES